MTRKRDWFVKVNQTMKNKVKFVDNSTLAIEGIGDVSIKIKNGENCLITNVLYVLGIKYSLLIIS